MIRSCPAFRALVDLDLTLDCLGFSRHLTNFHTLLTRYPDLRAVIDHCMKPQVGNRAGFATWAEGMRRIAEDTDARCKLSGLVTEADAAPSTPALRPYVDHVLGLFGADRVMWGSDWPVVRLRMEYADWHAMALDLTAHLSEADRRKVFSETARAFYRI